MKILHFKGKPLVIQDIEKYFVTNFVFRDQVTTFLISF